jgi:gas vesicle protein
MDENDLEKLLIGFGAGLLIGGMIGLLFAPYSGKELRMKLADVADDVSDRISRFKEPEKYSRIKP